VRLALHRPQTCLQLSLSSVHVQLVGVIQTSRALLGAEALDVVGDKGRAGKLVGVLGLDDIVGLNLSNLLQETLNGVGARLVLELINDAAGGEIEEGLAVLLEMLVCIGTSVESLDVGGVQVNGSSSILDNVIPDAQGIVASSTVGVEDGVGLAQNSLRVEVDGLVVVLAAIGLVAGILEL
jgi:hypothetical protein